MCVSPISHVFWCFVVGCPCVRAQVGSECFGSVQESVPVLICNMTPETSVQLNWKSVWELYFLGSND
jgi:hypothetical protein